MKKIKISTRRQGFSLVELLMTIAVIGVIASIAIAALGGASDAAKDQRDMRNAQEIASVAAMASAAGAKFVVPNDKAATIQNLVQGRAPASGVFKGRVFKLPPIESYAVTGAMKYLALNDTELCYMQKNN